MVSDNGKAAKQSQNTNINLPQVTQSREHQPAHASEKPESIMQRAIKLPYSLSPADVLGLQHGLGNRAVSQLMSASLQPRTNQTGIPDHTLSQMESSLNADFSNVRLHTNSPKASDINALAYTQGEDIHFAPGQYSSTSSQSQQILGHELAHVVQQRQGRVRPTMQLRGMQVNDDSSLEREADILGQRAAQNDTVQRRVPPASAYAGGGNAAAIQRKVFLGGKDILTDQTKYDELGTRIIGKSAEAFDAYWDLAHSDSTDEKFRYEWTLVGHFEDLGKKAVKAKATRSAFGTNYNTAKDATAMSTDPRKKMGVQDSDSGLQIGTELVGNTADATSGWMDYASDSADKTMKSQGIDDDTLKDPSVKLTTEQQAKRDQLTKEKNTATIASGSLGVSKGLIDFIFAVKKGADSQETSEKLEASIDAILAAGKMGGGIANIVAGTGDQNASKGADILGAIFEPLNSLKLLCKGIYDAYKKAKSQKQSDKTEGSAIWNDFFGFVKSGISAAYNIFKAAGGASDAFKMVGGPIIGVADSAISLICDIAGAVRAGIMKHKLGKKGDAIKKNKETYKYSHQAFETSHSKKVIFDKKWFSKDRIAAHASLTDVKARIAELEKIKASRAIVGPTRSGLRALTKEEQAELKSLTKMVEKDSDRTSSGYHEESVLDKEAMNKRRNEIEAMNDTDKATNKDELDMIYEYEEEELVGDLGDLNQERIVDNSIDAVIDLTALIGNILTIVGGPAAAAGAGMVLGAKIAGAVKAFAGKATQALRDYLGGTEQKADAALEGEKAHEAADLGTTEDKMKGPIKGALHSQLVNTEKSSSGIAQKYKRDIMIIMRMISRLPETTAHDAAEQYQRVELYLQATGVDLDALALAKDDFDDAMSLIVKSMLKRKILG